MTKILEQILAGLPEGGIVLEVAVYLHATMVISKRLGLASTFPKRSVGEPRDREDVIANHGRLTELSLRDLASYAQSSRVIEASIGVAAINAAMEPENQRLHQKGSVDLIMEYAAGRRLAIVGHLPFIERIHPLVKTLWVLESDPREGELPLSEAPNILPHADVVGITGTAFINHTIDGLLDLAKGKKVIILGPSTILSPVLFDFGVSALCGIQVDDEVTVLKMLKEGASFRTLNGISQVSLLA